MPQHSDGDRALADSPILTEALRLLREGWKVIPIQPGPGKRPLWKYLDYQRPTEAKVRQTWGRPNPPDLGVVLPEGTVVVDADSPAFIDALEPFIEQTYCTYTVLKDRGGQERRGIHAWFQGVEASLPGGRKAWRPVAHGLDIKGPGTVVIVPPSSGGRTAANNLPMQSVEDIKPLVERIVRGAGDVPRERMAPSLLSPGRQLVEGERNDGLLSLAGVLRKAGFSGDRLLAALKGLNADLCVPPVPADELDRIVESSSGYIPSPFQSRTYEMQLVTGAEKIPPTHFNVEWLWPSEAVTYIYGREGTGKSYICMTLAMSMLLGQPWADLKTRQGTLIYVDFERRGRVFLRRWKAMAKGLGLKSTPPIVYVQPSVPLPDFVDDLRGLINVHDAIGWLLDSFTIALTGVDVSKEHHKVISALNELKRLPAPGLVVDHRRKPVQGESSDVATGGFGSTFKQAVPSMVWRLVKASEGFMEGGFDFTLKHEKNNFDLNPPDIHAHIELGMKDSSIDVVRLERRTKEAAATQIADLMGAIPEPDGWTLSSLSLSTGLVKETVTSALKSLEGIGKVVVIRGRGRGNENRYFWREEQG